MALYRSFISIYMSLSIPLNAWMVVRCLRTKDHHVKHVLLASLAAGNLCHSLVGQGLQIVGNEGASNSNVCTWAQFFSWFAFVGSMVHFGSLSLEQFLLATNSELLNMLLRKRLFLPPSLWLYSGLLGVLPLVGWSNYLKFGIFYPGCEVSSKEWNFEDSVYLALLVLFGIMSPLCVAVVSQIKSYRAQSLSSITSIISLAYGDKKLYQRQKKVQQLNLACVAMLALVFLVWVPYLSCVLYFVITKKKVMFFKEAAPLIRESYVVLPSIVYWFWYTHYHSIIPHWVIKKRESWRNTSSGSQKGRLEDMQLAASDKADV